MKFVNGFHDLRRDHFMDFKAAAEIAQKRDGEFAAEVLAKFLQAVQNQEALVGISVQQFVRVKLESQRFQQSEDALRGPCAQKLHLARINNIQRNANGHRLTVADFVFRQLFELVRLPMAEI